MKRLIALSIVGLLGCATIADDRDWAKRITCDLQSAGTANLPTLTLLQGSTPLISADQYRGGKAVNAESNVTAILRFSPSMTNTLWVSVTNSSISGNGYLFQCPSLGTNATAWAYTILYIRNGSIYWTGNGRLDITKSEVAGNPLSWELPADISTAIATHNASTASHADKVTTNRTITVNGVTGKLTSNLVFTVTAETVPTNYVETAGVVVGSQSNLIATAWQNPASYTNWLRTTDGNYVFLTSYLGTDENVVIPDIIDGKKVTEIYPSCFSGNETVKKIYGGNNLDIVNVDAFINCSSLTNVILKSVKSWKDGCFLNCSSLQTVDASFAEKFGSAVFQGCTSLSEVYFNSNAPITTGSTFETLNENQVTNVILNSTSLGWEDTLDGMPVIRRPIKGGTVISIGAITAPSINFTNGTSLTWNGAEDVQSLEYTHPDGGTVTINGETYRMWKNIDDVAITNGQPVCLYAGSGRVGTIKLADADDPDRNCMIGIYTGDAVLPVNGIGRITTFGAVKDAPINAFMDSGISEGARLYLSTTRGHYTTNSPSAPTETIIAGIVTYVNPTPDKYDIEVSVNNQKLWTSLDARYVNTTGDTVTGSILSTIDHTTTAPSNNEFPTAGWVRGLAMSGAEWYFTPTVTNGFGEKTANFVSLASEIPLNVFTNRIASPVPSDTYLAGGITTNTYTSLRSPISVDAYLARSGGNASSVIPVHPEIYYVYAGTTNHFGDWEVADQQVTSTTPTRFTWVIAFPEPAITGSVHVIAYLKSGTVSGTAAGLDIFGGDGYSSHLDIQSTAAQSVDVSDRPTFAQTTNIVNALASSGGAPLAWTPIITGAGGTVCTANVTTARSIYYFESATAVSFTNNLSALPLNCTTNYQWTIAFNATSTNALSSTNWLGNVEFVGFTPELTVTGRYEYACETSCGTRIRVKQVYPTVYQWSNHPASESGSTALTFIPNLTAMADSATNDFLYIQALDMSKPMLLKISFSVAAASATNNTSIYYGASLTGGGDVYDGTEQAVICTSTATLFIKTLVLPPLNSLCTSFIAPYTNDFVVRYVLRFNRKYPTTGVLTAKAFLARPMNELEVNAYNAGWRP